MYELRWYQQEACQSAWSHLCGQDGNPVIVLPTGAGKSLVIAELCRAAVQDYRGRVIVLAHRAELLEQNGEKVRSLLPFSCGIYSAGLKSRATDEPVILAGIQSVFRRAEEFGERHLVVIDEVHLVPHDGEGMYRTFLNRLREVNPRLRMVGLTATPYRTGEGSLCRRDALFQRICYDAPIQRLIGNGFLCPLTSKPSSVQYDTSGLHIRGGEFIATEVEALFDDASKVKAACQEIVAKTTDRQSVLVFCSGVAHANHVRETIESLTGETCGVVTGDTSRLERATTLERFRSRSLRYLCNVDVLTTGFDAPCIDAIAILRATQSPGLFAQICGRGFRVFPGKQDCLVLDFGQNIARHGPVDAIDFGKSKSAMGLDSDTPVKQCPNCECECQLNAAECPECGWIFPPKAIARHETNAAEDEILAKPKTWLVEEVRFQRHRKRKAEPGTPDTLRVDYLCTPTEGGPPETVSEWVCLDHAGFAFSKAQKWWQARCNVDPDADENNSFIDSAIDLWKRGAVASPVKVTTIRDGKFLKITKHELEPIPDEWLDVAPEPVEFEAAVEQPF